MTENAEFVLAAFDAFQRRDVEWLMANTDPEVEVLMPPEVPDAKHYLGQDGLVQCIRDWDAQWETVSADAFHTSEPAPDRVLLGTRQRLQARGGMAIEQEVWSLFTLRDGKTLRWELFLSRPPTSG